MLKKALSFFSLYALVAVVGFYGGMLVGPSVLAPSVVEAQATCPTDSVKAEGFVASDPRTGTASAPVCIDTATGQLIFQVKNIVFEGATEDAFETTFSVTDPTADRAVTIPNVAGTMLFQQGTTITLTNVDLDTTDNSIAAHVCEDQTVTATGITTSDNIVWTMTTTNLAVTFGIGAIVPSAADTVTIRTCNNSAAGADPGAVADFKIVRLP